MIYETKIPLSKAELPTKKDKIRLRTFFDLLISEGYYDENCLRKLKEHTLLDYQKNGGFLCSDIRVLEYHTSYVNFLPFLKNANEINLKKIVNLKPEDYLKSIYQNAFEYLKVDNLIQNFIIESSTNFSDIPSENRLNYMTHKVKFENNGIYYEDIYTNLDNVLKNNIKQSSRNFNPCLISNKSINYLLVDINSTKRFIVSLQGDVMKTYSMNIETGKYFDGDICYASSYVKMESVLDKFSKNGFLEDLDKQTKNEIIKNYRFSSPQITFPSILISANTSKINKFKIFDLNKNQRTDWNKLIGVLTKEKLELKNFKDNLIDYELFIEQINKGYSSKSFSYKFEYEVNNQLIKKELLTLQKDRFLISEQNVFDLIFVELNKLLLDSGNRRQFYYDGFNYIYFLNKKEIKILKLSGCYFNF